MRTVLRVIVSVAGLVFFLAGIGFGGLPIANELQTNEYVTSAKPVDATVLSTNATRELGGGMDREESPDPYWSVRVTFRYTVDGTTYESGHVTPPGTAETGTNVRVDNQSAAEAFLADYPENATVRAYYPPSEPSNGFLVKRTTPLIALAIPGAFGGLFAVVGLVLVGFGSGVLSLRGM
ncbi:DUF3592 domain-containing protein [Haloplanus natans]|uniref:DUF3592 domain-containing protein n=1 Tax=Haloplanus natans TaxID=376171 RepID=UPI000678249B|nr:DUF3592 domain-containing protein [Haloplanus natans]